LESLGENLSFAVQCITLGIGLFLSHMIVRDALKWRDHKRKDKKKGGDK